MYCPKCGNQTFDDYSFCGHCGATLPLTSKQRCPECGQVSESNLPFCSGCGAVLPAMASAQSTSAPSHPLAAYAGFWPRFLAYVIDSIVAVLIMVILCLPLSFIISIPANFSRPTGTIGTMAAPFFIIWVVLIFFPWLYFTIFESSAWQATPGKRLAGLSVTDNTGARIGFGQANIRYWSKILSGFMMIGYIMAAFTERKQGLHDMIAGTLVLRR